MAARRAHNPKVVGSSPTPATKKLDTELSPDTLKRGRGFCFDYFPGEFRPGAVGPGSSEPIPVVAGESAGKSMLTCWNTRLANGPAAPSGPDRLAINPVGAKSCLTKVLNFARILC